MMNALSLNPLISPLLFGLLPLIGSPQSDPDSTSYRGRLWAITGNGATDTSYLYGTIHIRDAKAYQFPEGTMEALSKVDAYAGELNLDSIDPLALQGELVMKDSTKLRDLVTEKEYQDVKTYLKDSLGLPLEPFERMHPMLIISQAQMRSFKADSGQALDRYFHAQAKKKGHEIIGLERMSEQVSAFHSVPYDRSAEQLVQLARGEIDKSDGENSMQKMLDAYVEGRLSKLLEVTTEQKMSENFEELFLYDRNERMVERADKQLQEKSLFIAVGAAHLPGKRGMIELLRKKGYKLFSISDQNGSD